MLKVTNKKTERFKLLRRAKLLSGFKTDQQVIDEALKLLIIELEDKDHTSNNTFLSHAKDIAGCINGPIDLSINEKYLSEYGR